MKPYTHDVLGRSSDASSASGQSVCIDWYAEGQSRTVEAGGTKVTVRLIGRKGRRARIAITAPPGAIFSEQNGNVENE